MAIFVSRKAILPVVLTVAALAACSSYVRRDEFDATIADLRASDARLDAQRQALAQALQGLSGKYDAIAGTVREEGERGIRVDTVAYFDSGDAKLSDQAQRLLDDFADAIKASHGNAMITVEGFTDPSGPAAANERLGMRRAEAVRDYLVERGGLHPAQVQAVSYGEAENRLVVPGAAGADGRENRRVSLVIDYPGPRMSVLPESQEGKSARR